MMESSNIIQMISSPPQPVPPFPFIGIVALILIYVIILYLVVDFNGPTEDNNSRPLSTEDCRSGLSVDELQRLPWFDCGVNYKETCSVCLDGVKKGERCRMFPGCKHVFHALCIDLWLVRKLTCPTCRSSFRIKADVDVV